MRHENQFKVVGGREGVMMGNLKRYFARNTNTTRNINLSYLHRIYRTLRAVRGISGHLGPPGHQGALRDLIYKDGH